MAKKPERTEEEHLKLYKDIAMATFPYIGSELPQMGNITPESLVDDVGIMKIAEADLKKITKLLNNIIDSKVERGTSKVTGELYEMSLVNADQVRLNADLCRQWMLDHGATDDDFTSVMVDIPITQHKYKKL